MSSLNGAIVIRGARQHNLKNIDLTLPRGRFIVFTGVSGSGKSSLAFDTIFAEGQRRYVESLSAYARQFLGQLDKPDVDHIDGLSPAISIDQKSTSHNPRSTVGTVTEIYDYLRLLFARVGTPHCPQCGRVINPQTVEQIVDQVLALPEGSRIQVLAPLVRGRKGEYRQLLAEAAQEGFVRARVDGTVRDLAEEEIALDKQKKHSIEVVVDRLIVRSDIASRLADSLATALKKGSGVVIVEVRREGADVGGSDAGRGAPITSDVRRPTPDVTEDRLFSEHFACSDCGISLDEIAPRLFSFNSPYGACRTCHGLGARLELTVERVVPDPRRSIRNGAIAPWSRSGAPSAYYEMLLEGVAQHYRCSLDIPFEQLSKRHREILLHGAGEERIRFRHGSKDGTSGWYYTGRFEGVIPNLRRRYQDTESDYAREEIEKYMTAIPCSDCRGTRLRPESLAVKIQGRSIAEVCALSITDGRTWLDNLELTERQRLIARRILKELGERLQFLVEVGLDYLTLDRPAATLAGGEAQRIRLATQIGSGLTGVLYVLDEPSIGIHPLDIQRLLRTLVRLRDLGNTLIVVEHDEATIRTADHVVDIGPRAGIHGGEIVVQGTLDEIMKHPHSLTGQYMSGVRSIPVPERRRNGNGKHITIHRARKYNLKDLTVSFPLGRFICVTGVSGSGKSTLITEILYDYLRHHFQGNSPRPSEVDSVTGLEHIDKVIVIDQSPIGRTPRSNAATYTGLFDPLRETFAMTQEAKVRGYLKGRFSFNVKGGRCEACKGGGEIQIEMHFLPDVYIACDVCKGRRYNRETLEVRFKGKTIAEVLDMTVEEALEFFQNIPAARNKLQTLFDVGLDYLRLGQPATTLSGGEAQRVKLATELCKRSTGKTLFLLDEPTTGLSWFDVDKLLGVLNRLVDASNTVLVIEHNLDVVKTADYIIDLGPGGGIHGGTLVAAGTPEEVAACNTSHTGRFLWPFLNGRSARV